MSANHRKLHLASCILDSVLGIAIKSTYYSGTRHLLAFRTGPEPLLWDIRKSYCAMYVVHHQAAKPQTTILSSSGTARG
eukprot:863066-Pleurochrysis_carterae.AAC.3